MDGFSSLDMVGIREKRRKEVKGSKRRGHGRARGSTVQKQAREGRHGRAQGHRVAVLELRHYEVVARPCL